MFVSLLIVIVVSVVFIRRRARRRKPPPRAGGDSAHFPPKPELDGSNNINEVDAQETCFRGNEILGCQAYLVELSGCYTFHGRELPATSALRGLELRATTVLEG